MAGDLLPYFHLYAAETLADERFAGWSMAERGTWLTLLLHAWVNGSIPSDEAQLARIAHMTPAAFRKVWAPIADRFIPHPDRPDRLTSRRLEAERAEALAKSEAGKKGAKARWGGGAKPPPSDCDGDAAAMRPHTDRNAEPMPTEQNRTEQSRTSQPRAARVGVGSPAFPAVEHWTKTVWPRLSEALCPSVTTVQEQSLRVLCERHGPAVICAAMDAAAADEFWGSKLDLDTFISRNAKWLGRKATGPPKRGMAEVGQDFTKTLEDVLKEAG